MARIKTSAIVLLITATAVSIAHFIAALTSPAASPFIVIGSLFIDLTPTPLKTFAIETFGDKDKPILLASIGVTVALVALLIGIIFANRKRLLAAGVMTLATIPLAVALYKLPLEFSSLAPALTVMLVAAGSLFFWFSPKSIMTANEDQPQVSRRTVLGAAAGFAAVAAASATLGKYISDAKLAIGNITLPKPKNMLPKRTSAIENDIKGLTKLVTPQADLYRVDINLTVPVVDHNSWELEIKRDGFESVKYSYDDLLAMPLVERDITLACVSSSVGGEYNGSGRWLGVDLKTLLEPFDFTDGEVDQLFSTSDDGYTSSTSIERINDDAMIAVGFNGEVLNRTHGFPARLLVPGIYGYVGATKWLVSLELTTFDAKKSYWTKKDWAEDAPIKPQTRVDVPEAFKTVAKKTVVAGVAYAPTRGIETVQVQLDGGSWRNAMVEKPKNFGEDKNYWVQWMLPVELEEGSHSVSARCITLDGETQTAVRANPFPEGASGIHTINFSVE